MRHSRRNAAADGNEHAQSHIDGRNRGEQAASFIGAVLLTDIAGGGIRHPARKDEVQQLYRGVGQVECTDRTLHKDVGIQRGTPDDEQSLDTLAGRNSMASRVMVFLEDKRKTLTFRQIKSVYHVLSKKTNFVCRKIAEKAAFSCLTVLQSPCFHGILIILVKWRYLTLRIMHVMGGGDVAAPRPRL